MKHWVKTGSAELLKCGREAVITKVCELIQDVWITGMMPERWRRGTICPIHKKNDKAVCGNYRGIALLSIVYKVFMKILAWRLGPLVEDVIREYQCGFRQNRSVHHILEKCYKYKIYLYQLYVNFKQAYNSEQSKGFPSFTRIWYTGKINQINKNALKNMESAVKVEGRLLDMFEIKRLSLLWR